MKSLLRRTILMMCAGLPWISPMSGTGQEDHGFGILAIADKHDKSAWQIDSDVLDELSKLTVTRPEEAREIGQAFLSAVLKGSGNKKECCYKKVADGVWSCCDGTFITTNVVSLMKLFRLSEEGTDTTASPDLSVEAKALIEKIRQPDVFTAISEGDERLRAVWKKIENVTLT